MVVFHLIEHIARLLTVQIGNIECLLIMHLLAHELLFGVCGYFGHLLLRILFEVYHIIFLVDLWW